MKKIFSSKTVTARPRSGRSNPMHCVIHLQADGFVTLFLAMTTFLLVSPVFAAESGTQVGRLSYLEGRVDRKDTPSGDYTPVIKGEFIYPGDILRTKGFSRAEMSFADKSVVKLGENSQVELKEYKVRENGERENAHIFLDRGVLRAIVSKSLAGSQNFFIDTPNSIGSVKGSDIGVSYLKSASTFMSMSGAIETHHQKFPDQVVLVNKGSTVFIPLDGPPQSSRAYLPTEADRLDNETAPLLSRDSRLVAADLSKALVTDYTGDVRVRGHGTSQWHRVATKETLGEGDEVETGENGTLRMVLESGRIVELKNNTQISIKKFSVDPKTGFREDLLESKRGEIRARIEKLKGGSKFQVTTPTAIAAVRGTIMYLNISPALTHAFFEAGQGSLTSLVNGIEKLIDPGQNAQADNEGAVSDPVTTTPEQHEQLENGFNSQDQTYGYSSPDGNSITDTHLNDAEDSRGGKNTDTIDPTGNSNTVIFNDIPVPLPSTTSVALAPTFSGEVTNGSFFFFSDDRGFSEKGSIDGFLAGEGNIADAGRGHSTVDVLLGGTFETDGLDDAQPVVWNIGFNGEGFTGLAGGISTDGLSSAFAKAIYVAPNAVDGKYEAGILSGDLEGFFVGNEGEGVWLTGGLFSAEFRDRTATRPENLLNEIDSSPLAGVGSGSGNFGEGSGSLTIDSFQGNGMSILDQNWGIWNALMGGTFAGPEPTFMMSFSGLVNDSVRKEFFLHETVFLGTVSGDWNSTGDISGQVKGLWISEPHAGDLFLEAGTMSGKAFGNADMDSDHWQAITSGEFNRTTAELQLSQVKDFIDKNTVEFHITELTDLAANYKLYNGYFNDETGSVTGAVDTSFYGANGNSSTNGIWAALISGSFTGMPAQVDSWEAELSFGSSAYENVQAKLSGLQWSDNQWLATVNSTGASPIQFSGQAGGTYAFSPESTDSGSFSGAGVGVWQNNPPLPVDTDSHVE